GWDRASRPANSLRAARHSRRRVRPRGARSSKVCSRREGLACGTVAHSCFELMRRSCRYCSQSRGRARSRHRPRIELCARAEQRRATNDAAVHAVALILVITMTEGPLGAVLLRNMELLGRKLLA